MKNEIFLDFCIWDYEDISGDDITRVLNIKPVKVYIKGTRVNTNFNALAKKNGWRMSSGCNPSTPFEIQLESLLNILEEKQELLRPFCQKYYCEFSCAIYLKSIEESTPSVHLSSRYTRLVADLKIEFDLDLYYQST